MAITDQELLIEVSKTSIQLLLKEPFYGHFFTGIVKIVSLDVPTAGVRCINNLTVELAINKDFWISLDKNHQYGLLKHEILHIALKHITKRRNEKMPIALLANIAADMVVNQYIEKEMLPPNGIDVDEFTTLANRFEVEVKAHMDVDYYYGKLKKVMDKGAEMPNKYKLKEAEVEQWHKAQTSLDDLFARASDAIENHAEWDSFDKMDDAQKEIISSQIDGLLRNAVDRVGANCMAGNIPGSLLENLNAIINSAKSNLDWRRALRMFTATSSRTYLKNTMRRKSKRYGTNPGIKIVSKHHILVGVDTSGSMDIDEIQEFFSEIHHIWKQGSQVTVVEFDYEIQNTYKYTGTPPSEVKGRGGTDFDPLIELANEKIHPDILIIFTDGFINEIKNRSRKALMWMISSKGIAGDSEYWPILEEKGRMIKMKAIAELSASN